MKKVVLTAALVFFALALQAQQYHSSSNRAVRIFKEAAEAFRLREDEEAEKLIRKALRVDENFSEAWFMLAQIYLDRDRPRDAATYYLNGLKAHPGAVPGGYLKLAGVEYSAGMYQQAVNHLDQWRRSGYTDESMALEAKSLQEKIDFALEAVANPVPFQPENLGDSVNSDYYEHWPSLSVDEKKLFITVLLPVNKDQPVSFVNGQEDFFYATWEGNYWSERQNLGKPINTGDNEGAQSVTADGRTLFFTGCNRPDGYGLCDIYTSRWENGQWSVPVNLGEAVNTYHSEKHPSISADGRILYFTSNRPGGKGEYDLYRSVKTGNGWSNPENLGDSINTTAVEQSPFIHPDQQTLYFSSHGWTGMGAGDIFISQRKDSGSWSTPRNLGYPINTHNDEIGLIVNARGNKAYYASNRKSGTDTDIYTFDMPEKVRPVPVSYISGRVFDARNYRGLEATFQLIDLENGRLVMESASQPGEGSYLISLPANRQYAFNVSHPGYLFYSDHFSLGGTYTNLDPFEKNIPLQPIETGKNMVLRNIFFDLESATLKKLSRVELNKVVQFLEQNAGVVIEISGHTDSTGTDAFNQELSRERAESVASYLVQSGIDSSRIETAGYGDSRPLATNETEQGRAQNRRTEMTVVEIREGTN